MQVTDKWLSSAAADDGSTEWCHLTSVTSDWLHQLSCDRSFRGAERVPSCTSSNSHQSRTGTCKCTQWLWCVLCRNAVLVLSKYSDYRNTEVIDPQRNITSHQPNSVQNYEYLKKSLFLRVTQLYLMYVTVAVWSISCWWGIQTDLSVLCATTLAVSVQSTDYCTCVVVLILCCTSISSEDPVMLFCVPPSGPGPAVVQLWGHSCQCDITAVSAMMRSGALCTQSKLYVKNNFLSFLDSFVSCTFFTLSAVWCKKKNASCK